MGKYNDDDCDDEEEEEKEEKEEYEEKEEKEEYAENGDVDWSTLLTLGLAFHACQGAQTVSHHHWKLNGRDDLSALWAAFYVPMLHTMQCTGPMCMPNPMHQYVFKDGFPNKENHVLFFSSGKCFLSELKNKTICQNCKMYL